MREALAAIMASVKMAKVAKMAGAFVSTIAPRVEVINAGATACVEYDGSNDAMRWTYPSSTEVISEV